MNFCFAHQLYYLDPTIQIVKSDEHLFDLFGLANFLKTRVSVQMEIDIKAPFHLSFAEFQSNGQTNVHPKGVSDKMFH